MIWCVLNWSNQSQSHSDACIIRAVCFNNSINRTTSPPREKPNKHYDMQTGKIIRQTFFHAISLWNIVVHIAHHSSIYHWHVFICIYFSFRKMIQTKHWFRGKTTHIYMGRLHHWRILFETTQFIYLIYYEASILWKW